MLSRGWLLTAAGWLAACAQVVVELTLFNPSHNMFLVAQMGCEFTSGGYVMPTAMVDTVKLVTYHTDSDRLRFVFEVRDTVQLIDAGDHHNHSPNIFRLYVCVCCVCLPVRCVRHDVCVRLPRDS